MPHCWENIGKENRLGREKRSNEFSRSLALQKKGLVLNWWVLEAGICGILYLNWTEKLEILNMILNFCCFIHACQFPASCCLTLTVSILLGEVRSKRWRCSAGRSYVIPQKSKTGDIARIPEVISCVSVSSLTMLSNERRKEQGSGQWWRRRDFYFVKAPESI